MQNDSFDQFKTELTEYGSALSKAGKLRMVSLISRLLGLFLLILSLVLLVFAILSFGAVAIIHALSNHMPIWAASLIMGALYFLLIVITISCRKQLFIHPFIRLLTAEIKTEEELEKKTIEADYQVDLRRIRIETQVENATREFTFYTKLVYRVWNFITGKFRK